MKPQQQHYGFGPAPSTRLGAIIEHIQAMTTAPVTAPTNGSLLWQNEAREELAVRFGIQSIPTLVLFKNGKVVQKFVGSLSSATLIEAIEEVAKSHPKRVHP